MKTTDTNTNIGEIFFNEEDKDTCFNWDEVLGFLLLKS